MLMRNFNGVDTNMGVIFPSRTTMPYKGFNKGMRVIMDETDLADIRRIAKDIEYSSGMTHTGATAAYKTKSKSVMAMGAEPDFYKMQTPKIISGRVFNDHDVFSRKKVLTIGKNLADELFGSEDPVGKFISVNGIYFQVIGVVAQLSEANIGSRLDDNVQIPAQTMRRAFNLGTNVDFFIFTTPAGINPAEAKPYILRAMRQNHPIHPDDPSAIGMMNVAEQFEMVNNLFLGISILALFVGAGTLIAGIIGIGNIMWIIVKERTQEIGIRRAIGAKPRDIIVQILSEGMVLTAIAGIAGICLATIVLFAVDTATYDPILGGANFQLRFSHAMTIMVVFLILGTCAGLIPSIKAMRIKPIEAMRDK